MTTEPTPIKLHHVFLSYSRADALFALRLKADLEAQGHEVWIDQTDIKGGDEWIESIVTGIDGCHTLITIVSEAANQSKWVRREFLFAEEKAKTILPIWAEACKLPIYMLDINATKGYDEHYAPMLDKVLASLPAPTAPASAPAPPPDPRRAYLDRLWLKHKIWLETYTPMAGVARLAEQQRPHVRRRVDADMVPSFQSLTKAISATFGEPAPTREENFDDIITAVKQAKQLVVLGDPGAGKSTTLWKLAADYADLARHDDSAALPVLLRLGGVQAEESIEAALQAELGGVGLAGVLATTGVVLLFDGLNELPLAGRAEKVAQIKGYIQQAQATGGVAVVTCRELDYQGGLDLGIAQQVRISPLDPPRVYDFVNRHLPDDGEALFWQLAGGDTVREVWEKWEALGASFELFWTAEDIPREEPNVFSKTSGDQDRIWREAVHGARSLMKLARNPYMLFMMTEVFADTGTLPANRGKLFEVFVDFLLLHREKLEAGAAADLKGRLAQLAYAMQHDNLGTIVGRAVALRYGDEAALRLALSANLLEGVDEMRFTHQLLQEFFAARQLDVERLHQPASHYWPVDKLREGTGWEETAILMAGLHQADCTPVIEWLRNANPDLTVRCIVESGAHTPEATIKALQPRWLPRLTDINGDPVPRARAAIGQGLALLNLDNRRGVGLNAAGLPDIEWVTIDDGAEWVYQTEKRPALPAYQMARYPVTYAQFQAFVDDPDGAGQACWYQGLAAGENDRVMREQYFKYGNHPRENVNWYQAIAFCRWLTWRLAGDSVGDSVGDFVREGHDPPLRNPAPTLPPDGTLPVIKGVDWDDPMTWAVRLPTEEEWERAARGTDGRQYPWGDKFEVGYCNNRVDRDRAIGLTSVVGMYPQGVSPSGMEDAAGNVWEWVLTEYDNHGIIDIINNKNRRVVRGGSWYDLLTDYFRVVNRSWVGVDNWDNNLGFRLARSLLITSKF